ncbi:MAG: HAD family hydrolase [Deltaproteobacteria bacterium]|nr:HAD family hydrolase [Deltaproteobacteria bacterium]
MKSEFPSNARIKAVYFDAAGTLIKPTRRVGESYAAIAAKYGKTVVPSDLFERFRSCFAAAPRLAFANAAPDEIAGLEREWWKTVVGQVFEPFGPFDNFDDYFDELFGYFAEPSAWTLFPEVLATLSALQRRGVTLAVISNFDSRLLSILDGLNIASRFETILVSSRVGYAKPDPKIFAAALDRHGLRPEQALHVGDDEDNDLHGAENAGLSGLLIDRQQAASQNAPKHIASLEEIISRLG